jgi:hypothetical protein
MTDRPQLLSWLRRQLRASLAENRLVWMQPTHAKYKHAKLDADAQAAICGRYATVWRDPKARIRHCDICLDLIAQAHAGDTQTVGATIELSDNAEDQEGG